jgi:hypothetical protein
MKGVRFKLLLLLLLLLFGAGALMWCQLRYQTVQMVGVNRLVLQSWSSDASHTNTVIVTEAADIAGFLALLRLKTKEPCACIHLYKVRFEMAAETAVGSMCDHCFDLVRSNKVANYAMSPHLWKMISERVNPEER